MKRPNNIIFSDLDGTLIKTKSGATFPVDKDDWELIPKNVNYINNILLHSRINYKVIIVTNQAGIGKYSTPEDFHSKMEAIKSVLPFKFHRCFIADTINSPYRKPKVDQILLDLKSEDLLFSTSSLMIGDAGGREKDFSDSDKKFADNMGIKFIHVDDIYE